ncbi:MAG: hypothetical protein IJF07_05275 [Lachnospiraceae bacterium]|nr:hypothetical protein [Lachnospiraceae bacterium]
MKRKLYKLILCFCLMFFVLSGNCAMVQAADAYIVYQNPNGFDTQAQYMKNRYSPGAKVHYVRSSADFVKKWNSLSNVDNLIIMVHGGTGCLYFYNEAGWSNYSSLNYLGSVVKGNVMLLSCQGGTGRTSSVAYNLSKRTGRGVVCAKDSAVNYNWLFNKNPDLDDKENGEWVKISAIKGRTYKCKSLGTKWKYNLLNQ